MATQDYGLIEILESNDGSLTSRHPREKQLTKLEVSPDAKRTNYYKHTFMIKMDIQQSEKKPHTKKFEICVSVPSLSFVQSYAEEVKSSESGVFEAVRVLSTIEGLYDAACEDRTLQIEISESGEVIREINIPLKFV